VTWLLVIVLIHTDGTISSNELPGFGSPRECQDIGRAWVAQANHRPDQTDVALYRCVGRRWPPAAP
jgi:hypothetical protein